MPILKFGSLCNGVFLLHNQPKRNFILSTVQSLHQNLRHLRITKHFQMFEDFFFKQLFDRTICTSYSYLLADINSIQLRSKSIVSEASQGAADIKVQHGDTIVFGKHKLEVRAIPRHTNGCVTYVCHDQGIAFTGDTILIRGCGRTDFQEGNAETLYHSVHNQIFSLPENFRLFPAHDYNGVMDTTVSEERQLNPRLTKSKEEFTRIMKNLNLAYPAQIDKALPANKLCGLYNLPSDVEEKFKEVLQQ